MSTSKVRELKSLPGVMSTVLEHEVTKTTHTWKWTGPVLNPVWPEILAFFKWTYDTMKSESQVRLFVNVRTKEWKAWAFPQKAKTFMTAHEIKEGEEGYDKTVAQRAQFPDPDWYYWGTVHHHCSAGAFQSGTDENNETSQDGLHITVGKMDGPMHDLHFRVYVGKRKLGEIAITDFWDIGNALMEIPEKMRKFMQKNIAEVIAIEQMCTPVPATQTFPEIWKQNVIDIRPPEVATVQMGKVVTGNRTQTEYGNGTNFHVYQRPFTLRSKHDFPCDRDKALARIVAYMESHNNPLEFPFEIEDVIKSLEHLERTLDDCDMNIFDILSKCDVLPSNMVKHITDILTEQSERDLATGGAGQPKKLSKKERKEQKRQQQQNQNNQGHKPQTTKEEVLGIATGPKTLTLPAPGQSGGNSGLEKDQQTQLEEFQARQQQGFYSGIHGHGGGMMD